MTSYSRHASTSSVLAWSAHTASMQPSAEDEAGADVDEPPDESRSPVFRPCHTFEKTPAYRRQDQAQSLLTKALQSQSEDENLQSGGAAGDNTRRRRSITSNTSMASTADFTSDTGITTPPRTNSPSPCLAAMGAVPVRAKLAINFATPPKELHADATPKVACQNAPAVPVAPATVQPRKRCISFACANPRPEANKAHDKPAPGGLKRATTLPKDEPSKAPEPRRPCIKFACLIRPPTVSHKPHPSALKVDGADGRKFARKPSPAPEPRSPTLLRKQLRGSSSGRSPRSLTRSPAARQSSHSPLAVRSKKYLTAKPEDLNGESSRFHEFASDAPLEDDWIRHAHSTIGQRMTIDDTLKKELAIRQLAREAEEEAAQEEQDEDEEDEEGEDDEEDDDVLDDEEEEEDEDGEEEDADENDTVEGNNDYVSVNGDEYLDNVSDGYNTDNEIGFASSDDEDDGLVLWTVRRTAHPRRTEDYRDVGHSTLHGVGSPVFRRLSIDDQSDSSAFIEGQAIRQGKPKNRELTGNGRPLTPELPDSTDFVCGTFDEDRPLEEAYLSHMAARKRGKYLTIPQDIDPSFPTSDVEGQSENDEAVTFTKQQQHQQKHPQKEHHGSADDDLWLHGELEDLHHEQADRAENRRKKDKSPRRCRSPPPPKTRGRSPAPRQAPRQLFDRHSPGRRMKSPAPKNVPVLSPRASPVEISAVDKVAHQMLAFRPGLTQAKSLPRPPAMFRHPPPIKQCRKLKANGMACTKPMHIRGALDIVKGLEQKRQRRKEKFQLKYCNRARKGQAPDRRPQRGEGAERMRELGLLMAGKIGQGHYVLSI